MVGGDADKASDFASRKKQSHPQPRPQRRGRAKNANRDKGTSSSGSKRKRPTSSSAIVRDEEEEDEGDGEEEDGDELPGVSRRAKKKPKAVRFGRTAGKQYPPEIRRALGRANGMYVAGKIQEASRELEKVVMQCSSIPEPYALLGLIYQDTGKYTESLLFYKLACTRDPRNLLNHQEAARIAGVIGDHTSRLEALRVLARLQPNDLNVAIERARCLLELEKPRQALEAYAKAAKRFPRKLDIYVDLAEGVECISPQQHIFVHQALALCLRRAMGKRYLGPDVKDLADAFSTRLREIKLENPKPKRLPPRPHGLPSRRMYEMAMKTADLLIAKLMESRKRQEPQYDTAVQVVEGLVSWLGACRRMATREGLLGAGGGGGGGEDFNEDDMDGEDYDDEVDSDSDLRDSNDEASDGDEDSSDSSDGGSGGVGGSATGAGRRGAEGGYDEEDEDDEEPMDRFTVDPMILLRYGICQLYCGEKEKASQAFAFLGNEDADGPYGDMMLEIAKVYSETDNVVESIVFLRQVAQSTYSRRRFAGVQLGAAYASQGKHELASDAYSAVLAERPSHAAALAGLAESAYWLGRGVAPSALLMLSPEIEKMVSASEPADEVPATVREDDEGEDAIGFQRLQLLIQWATLSRMSGNMRDFACVALPLVGVTLGQMKQRLQFEQEQVAVIHMPSSGGRGTKRGATNAESERRGIESESEQQGQDTEDRPDGEGNDEGGGEINTISEKKPQAAAPWEPSPVPPLVPKRSWQAGLPGKITSLTLKLLEAIDVLAHVGRRAVFWHAIELVRSLITLEIPEDAAAVASATINQTGFLKGLERGDMQAVASADDTVVVLRSMPGGSPILGPASREPVILGPRSLDDASPDVEDTTAAVTPPEQYFEPPWRCIEDKDEDGVPRRGGRGWGGAGSGRPPQAGPRRSRSRTLMELEAQEKDGDPICALVRALSRTPGNNAMWNLLQRVATEQGVDAGDGGFHGEQVEALVGRHRERSQGLLYRGHDAAVWNRSKQALRLYSQAHAMCPQEPLPILCLATHIIRMVTVMETMVQHDGVCVLQALACLHRYAEVRKAQMSPASGVAGGFINKNTRDTTSSNTAKEQPTMPEAVLEQEIMYNLGRGYHQVGLEDLAIEYYNRALRIQNERGDELRNWHGGEGVTKEAAHNLCTLYKRNGSVSMALSVLHKYLSIG